MANDIETMSPSQMMMSPEGFKHMNAVASAYAYSTLFPEHLRKGPDGTARANAVLVLNMAWRLKEDPLTIAQNIYFVGGKPGWSASYMIMRANMSDVFDGEIDWTVDGQGEGLEVTAFATLKKSGRRVEYKTSMKMAEADGWTKNVKYRTMPELMLRYRSATAMIRLYCGQVMYGIGHAVEELEDGEMVDVTPKPEGRIRRQEKPKPEIVDADPIAKEEKTDSAADLEARAGAAAALARQEIAKQSADKRAADLELAQKKAAEQKEMHDIAAKAAIQRAEDGRKDASEFEAMHKKTVDGENEVSKDDLLRLQNIYNQILNDLLDAGSVDDVVDMYGKQIGEMQAKDPALHEKLLLEIAAARDE